MSDVIVVIGAGQIGQAIARRISAGKHVLLADLHKSNAEEAAEVLANAGFNVSTTTVDVSSRESVHALIETATALGDVSGVIHAAGVSPSQATPEVILAVDLYGTALVLEEFGNIIAPGGSAVVIASQSGHRLGALTAEQDAALTQSSRRTAGIADAPAGSGRRLPARLSAGQARQLTASQRRGRPLGQTRRPGEHHQPWHHHHPPGQG
jgi:NAD(P)-dependent dehydrogenase (short-subunit alcohol dehydrogenase family)